MTIHLPGYIAGMTTHTHDDDARRAREAGESTEAAKLLHGDRAAVETNPQPDAVTLDSGTRIAVPDEEPADDDR